MKAIILALALLLSPVLLNAQQTSEWERVYTFDESAIEMNTLQVSFSGPNTGRVRFRWNFDKPKALSGEPQIKYKSRLEVIEFDCSRERYRLSALTLFDSAGKVVRSQEMSWFIEWKPISSGNVTDQLYNSACKLIELRRHPPAPPSAETIAKEKVEKLALSFTQQLEKKKDFAPLIREFFAPDYLDGYLRDKDQNYFLTLNPEVAAKASRADLQRYYIALLNAGYLGSVYFVSQSPAESDVPPPDEKIVPPGLVTLIRNHPYTTTYKGTKSDYDYLAEKIDSAERLRRYTDLLESVATFFRQKIIQTSVKNRENYDAALEDMGHGSLSPEIWACHKECFGLPEGTQLFQVDAPFFRLQFAELTGEMKIVSVMPNF